MSSKLCVLTPCQDLMASAFLCHGCLSHLSFRCAFMRPFIQRHGYKQESILEETFQSQISWSAFQITLSKVYLSKTRDLSPHTDSHIKLSEWVFSVAGICVFCPLFSNTTVSHIKKLLIDQVVLYEWFLLVYAQPWLDCLFKKKKKWCNSSKLRQV